MADEKPLTKSDLVAALKDFRKDVRDIVHDELTEFHANMTKPEIEKLRQEMKAGFKDVDTRLGRVEAELHWVKDEVKGLKEEFSTTPSRQEFNRLKARVEKYHPTN
jgi:uncharacterized protein YpuA (DUF1002 family)